MSAPDFWDNPEAARALMNEVNPLKRRLEQFRSLESGLEDVEVAVEMAAEDYDMAPEAKAEYDTMQKWRATAKRWATDLLSQYPELC